MATTTIHNMLVDVSPHVVGCPDYVMEQALLATIRELCERARVWRAYTVDIPLVPGTYTYQETLANTDAEVVAEVQAYTIINAKRRTLEPLAYSDVLQRYPSWPDLDPVTMDPEVYTALDNSGIMLAPIPYQAGTLRVIAALRPTLAATTWDSGMYNEHKRTVFHGTLYNLMTMPSRTWSDAKSAQIHGKQWNFMLNAARVRANRSYNQMSASITMRPLA
jgi:hypothetical protein